MKIQKEKVIVECLYSVRKPVIGQKQSLLHRATPPWRTSELSMAVFSTLECALTACTAAFWAVIACRVTDAVWLRASSKLLAKAEKRNNS